MAMAGVPPAGGDALLHTTEIRLNGELLGRLVLNQSTARMTETLAVRQRELFFGQMLAILAVLTVGFAALSRFIIHPLSLIAHTIRQNTRSGEAHLTRVALDSNDEFGDLARGFNALGERLDRASDKLTSRIQAADQELREAYEQLERQAEALRTLNRELEQQNITDPLTGLYNRRYFDSLMQNEVEKLIRNDETVSILLIEIDDFQSAVERLGHAAGDEIIRGVAALIAQRTRSTDVTCRYSSSEFIMLCRRATIANAIAIADNIQDAVTTQPLVVRDQSQPVRISVGVATIPGVHRVTSAAEFFQCAEDALRYARQHDGGVIHYSMLDHQPRTALL
jgi:diguanylate cyclase (GGDEF)-like protein